MWKSCTLLTSNQNTLPISFRHFRSNISTNRILRFKNTSSKIPNPGKYAYIIEFKPETHSQFELSLIEYKNPLEFCSKYFHLRSNNSYVVAAGECYFEKNNVVFNLLSGTYTLPILNQFEHILGLNKNLTKKAMIDICKYVFGKYLNANTEFTNSTIFNNFPITKSNLPQPINTSRITLPKKYIDVVRSKAPHGSKKEAEYYERKRLENFLKV
jgi:hypothetical protein